MNIEKMTFCQKASAFVAGKKFFAIAQQEWTVGEGY
jgi:hypothetical protein